MSKCLLKKHEEGGLGQQNYFLMKMITCKKYIKNKRLNVFVVGHFSIFQTTYLWLMKKQFYKKAFSQKPVNSRK